MRWNQLATRVLLSSACGLAPASAMAQHHHGGGGAAPAHHGGGMTQAPAHQHSMPTPGHPSPTQGFVHPQPARGFSGQPHNPGMTPAHSQASRGGTPAPPSSHGPRQSASSGTHSNPFAQGMTTHQPHGTASNALTARPSRTNPFGNGPVHQSGPATRHEVARPAFSSTPNLGTAHANNLSPKTNHTNGHPPSTSVPPAKTPSTVHNPAQHGNGSTSNFVHNPPNHSKVGTSPVSSSPHLLGNPPKHVIGAATKPGNSPTTNPSSNKPLTKPPAPPASPASNAAINRLNQLFVNVNISNNTIIKNRVGGFWNGYWGNYGPWWTALGSYYATLYQPSLVAAYDEYAPYGFVGGYDYPVTPCQNLGTAMYTPAMYWMCNAYSDPTYYTAYYGQGDDGCDSPDPATDLPGGDVQPFAYANYYFATDALARLAQEVSGDASRFAVFRDRMTILTEQIQERVDELAGGPVSLANGSLVINYCTNLQNGAAYKLVGMIETKIGDGPNTTAIQLPFTAVLDMASADGTGVFIPSSTTPTTADLDALKRLNARLAELES